NYRFDMRFAPEEVQDCQVVIDMDRIIQVLTNLVFNAIKYTPAGGQITIVADRNEEVRVENAVGELVIQVKDTGVGIEPDALPYVFDRFYRQTNAVNGTSGTSGSGIGLAIAKEIVQYHEGVITAASTVGEGSAFTFTLPMYQIDA